MYYTIMVVTPTNKRAYVKCMRFGRDVRSFKPLIAYTLDRRDILRISYKSLADELAFCVKRANPSSKTYVILNDPEVSQFEEDSYEV